MINILREGRKVYRISTSGFWAYQTSAFFFDPDVDNSKFKILQPKLVTSAELKSVRLEITGIFGIGTHLDNLERFEQDVVSRVLHFLAVLLVFLGVLAGFCGIRLLKLWRDLKKQRARKKKQLPKILGQLRS